MDIKSYILGKKAGGGSEINNQNKNITITENGSTSVSADTGYTGLGTVGITTSVTPDTETKSVTITENTTTVIEKSANKDGMTSVSVTTNVEPDLEEKSVTITTNGTTTVTPSQDKDGISSVSVTTNVDADVSDYFEDEITGSETYGIGGRWFYTIKKLPPMEVNLTNAQNIFQDYRGTSLKMVTFKKPLMYASYMFSKCTNLLSNNLPQFDTTNVTVFNSMFENCISFTSIPSVNLTSATSCQGMFQYCKFTSIDCSGLDFSNNTQTMLSMNNMFAYCSNLTNITNLNTSKTTTFGGTFLNCSSLVTAPNLDTSKATSMNSMFSNCTNLENVPIYNTSFVSTFSTMFSQCNKLTDTSLDNILQMCINATNYTGTKKFTILGFSVTGTTAYPPSRIQALPHYQDFIDAGWTIN